MGNEEKKPRSQPSALAHLLSLMALPRNNIFHVALECRDSSSSTLASKARTVFFFLAAGASASGAFRGWEGGVLPEPEALQELLEKPRMSAPCERWA